MGPRLPRDRPTEVLTQEREQKYKNNDSGKKGGEDASKGMTIMIISEREVHYYFRKIISEKGHINIIECQKEVDQRYFSIMWILIGKNQLERKRLKRCIRIIDQLCN